MLLFAEQLPAPDSFQGIGWMIVAVSALVVLVERGMALYAHFRPTPPPGELHLTSAQLAKRISDLEVLREKDQQKASDRRQLIYDEFKKQRDDFLQEIKDVYAQIDKERALVNTALRDLPNEIIATLRNTGVIK